jgi:O-antigen/teichoic acid export membrane protein
MHRPQTARTQAAFLLITGRVIGSLMTIVTAGLLSRWWSEREYGEYREVWLAFQVLSPFVTLGVPAGLAFLFPQIDRSRQKAAVAQLALLLVFVGSLISIATIAWSHLARSPGTAANLSVATTFALFPMLALPLLVVDGWLIAIGQSRSAAWFTVQTAVLQALGTILPAASGCGITTVISCLTLTTLIRFLIAAWIYRLEYCDVPSCWDLSFLTRLLAYTAPLGMAGIIASVHLMLDKMTVNYWFTVESFAIYSNGATELPFVGIVSSSVAAILAPDFVRFFREGRAQEALELWKSSIRKTAILIFPLTASVFLYAPDAVTLLYSEKYMDSVPIFRTYLLLMPLRITVHGALLLAAGRSKVLFVSSIIGLIVACLSLVALLPLWGMLGAAVSIVLSVYVVACTLLVSSARITGQTVWRVFPWKALAVTLLASLAGAVTSLLFTQQLAPGPLRLIAGATVTGCAAVALQASSRRSREELVCIVLAILGRVFHPQSLPSKPAARLTRQ